MYSCSCFSNISIAPTPALCLFPDIASAPVLDLAFVSKFSPVFTPSVYRAPTRAPYPALTPTPPASSPALVYCYGPSNT